MANQSQSEQGQSSAQELLFSKDTAVQFVLFLLMLVVFAPVLSEAFTAVTLGTLELPSWISAGAGVLTSAVMAVVMRLTEF